MTLIEVPGILFVWRTYLYNSDGRGVVLKLRRFSVTNNEHR